MDGSNHTILHNTDLIWPHGITIDYENQILYWIDASLDTLEYSNVDGSGQTLMNQCGEIAHPFSITLNDDYLFWTDWQQLAIFTTHKNLTKCTITSFYQLTLRAHGIEAVTPDRQRDGEYTLCYVLKFQLKNVLKFSDDSCFSLCLQMKILPTYTIL